MKKALGVLLLHVAYFGFIIWASFLADSGRHLWDCLLYGGSFLAVIWLFVLAGIILHNEQNKGDEEEAQ